MSRLATRRGLDSRRAQYGKASSPRYAAAGAAELASTDLMPVGSGLDMPRLAGMAIEQQLWQGEQAAARLAHIFLDAGIADPDDWIATEHNPFQFLQAALERWLRNHGSAVIREQFSVDVLVSTRLDRYIAGDSGSDDIYRVFIALEPDAAGYVILGPTLQLLESVHPRLPGTFLDLFLGALNRWVRVYDRCDALDRVERLREWYEGDPEAGDVELPDIDRWLPDCVKRKRRGRRTLAAVMRKIENPVARELLALGIELDRVSSARKRPAIENETRDLLMDCGEPVPALLAVFERNDPIEGCFDEDCQAMLEVTPEPNLIIPFNGQTREGVLGAFTVLGAACDTLSVASRLLAIMPGNER